MPAPLFSRLVGKMFARPASRRDRRRATRLGLEALEGRDVPNATVSVETLADATEGGSAGTVRVTWDGPASYGMWVILQTGGTANSYDYTVTRGGSSASLSGYIQLPGPGSYDFTVTAVDDSQIEGTETLTISAQSYIGYDAGASAELTIYDNDFPPPPPPPPVVSVGGIADAIEGGAVGLFRFSRSGDTGSSLSVSYTFETGTGLATPGPDFVEPSGTVDIPAGWTYADVEIAAWTDNDYDPDEEVKILITPNPGAYLSYAESGTAFIPITDTSFVVTTTADTFDTTDNRVSLREAMSVANVAPRVNHRGISFNFPGTTGTITLTSTLPGIWKAVSIGGPADRGVTITGGGGQRLMQVDAGGDLQVAGLKFRNANTASVGGAIYTRGVLSVTNCEFSHNSAPNGGAIAGSKGITDDPVGITIWNSDIMRNSAVNTGGGIFVENMDLTVHNSLIYFNDAGLDGGGIASVSTPPEIPPPGQSGRNFIYISGTQLVRNVADQFGGGMYIQFARLRLGGATFDSNRADRGGGLYVEDSAVTIGIEGETQFAGNQATLGRGIFLRANSAIENELFITFGGGDDLFSEVV